MVSMSFVMCKEDLAEELDEIQDVRAGSFLKVFFLWWLCIDCHERIMRLAIVGQTRKERKRKAQRRTQK